LRRADVLRKSLDEAIRYVERAKAALNAFPPSEERDLLTGLADFVVERHR
jgi:geranylgeranyl pyrophosphate synthase